MATRNDDEEAIQALLASWQDATRNADVERLVSLVTEDAVFLAPRQAPIRGRRQVRDVYGAVFSRFAVEQSFALDELQVLGEWAFCWGTDSMTMRPLGEGEVQRAGGMALSLLRRGQDGAWRFARGINNMARREPADSTE